MNPIKLIINDFGPHGKSEIDFTKFNAALVVGKENGNDHVSNGVGKTTIFKAIEYVLFNQAGTNLEKIVRHDANSCKIILYFETDGNLYRISRSRTKKGINDLSFHIRTEISADDSDVFVDKIEKDSVIWRNISGRRTADTEDAIEEIIKVNYKMFANTSHFLQQDLGGLSTLTAEKRKTLLREVFHLLTYSKLEKITKEQQSALLKSIEKDEYLIDSLKSLDEDIVKANDLLSQNTSDAKSLKTDLSNLEISHTDKNKEFDLVNNQLLLISEKFNSIKGKEKSIKYDIEKITKSIGDFSVKKKNASDEAKSLISKISLIKDEINDLKSKYDENLINSLKLEMDNNKIKITENNVAIKNNTIKLEELSIPLPTGSTCSHCRSILTEEHRLLAKIDIDKSIASVKKQINEAKKQNEDLNSSQKANSDKINELIKINDKIAKLSENTILYNNDINSKKELYSEYNSLINKLNDDLLLKNNELLEINKELELCDLGAISDFDSKKTVLLKEVQFLKQNIENKNKALLEISNKIAVLNHSISTYKENLLKRDDAEKNIKINRKKNKVYDAVIKSFSSYGIPNLIIQNVLDDLQNESNEVLNRIRPGLQLSFVVEKERSDGVLDDTLDIKYYLNNRDLDYGMLSGAQKVSVAFALKLGLAFLLQKMFGAEIKLLLLDEIDPALDKVGVDAYAEIVKSFQSDFKILVITHNDRLKDKFSHAIVVEQDSSGVSSAKVQEVW